MKNEWLKINQAVKILNEKLGRKKFTFKMLKKKIEDSELWAINISDSETPIWRIKKEWLDSFYSTLTTNFQPSKAEKEEALLSPLLEKLDQNLTLQELRELVKELPEKEREIIELRYGLKDGIFKSLERVAKKFKTTRQVIWIYEKQAIGRMKDFISKNPKFKAKEHAEK